MVFAVSTHSRPKAAAYSQIYRQRPLHVSTHSRPPSWRNHQSFNTQPPEGGCRLFHVICRQAVVSTHSRPKAAAADIATNGLTIVFQHTAARRRLLYSCRSIKPIMMFQHTAARRRLPNSERLKKRVGVFQHTAARRRLPCALPASIGLQRFNTQPPEGGCELRSIFARRLGWVSTHSRPKAAARPVKHAIAIFHVSTHSRPKAAACFGR